MDSLALSLFGAFRLTLNGEPITSFESSKVQGFVAYLAADADRPHYRTVLATLFWPDHPQHNSMEFRTPLPYMLDVASFATLLGAERSLPVAGMIFLCGCGMPPRGLSVLCCNRSALMQA